jgi:ABC-type branched-subunit amino acid transport system permease subunit
MSEDRVADIVLIGGYLTIIGLRIFGVINWNWLWILCPFWLPVAGALLGLAIGIIIGVPITIYRKIRGIRNERY